MDKIFQTNLQQNRIFRPDEIGDMLQEARPLLRLGRKFQGVERYETSAAFDIETTSFVQGGIKAATMYVWMLGLAGLVMVGRTWEEYLATYQAIC